MSTDTLSTSVLPDHVHEDQLAQELGISRRTLARYRGDGLPYARIGGRIFIHRQGARTFFDNRTIGLKTKKRARP
jgi:hypothetical protein